MSTEARAAWQRGKGAFRQRLLSPSRRRRSSRLAPRSTRAAPTRTGGPERPQRWSFLWQLGRDRRLRGRDESASPSPYPGEPTPKRRMIAALPSASSTSLSTSSWYPGRSRSKSAAAASAYSLVVIPRRTGSVDAITFACPEGSRTVTLSLTNHCGGRAIVSPASNWSDLVPPFCNSTAISRRTCRSTARLAIGVSHAALTSAQNPSHGLPYASSMLSHGQAP